jgi:hypothetical protein
MLKLKTFRDKIALSGITVLFLGVGLLIFTFFTAFGFLSESLSLITYRDLASFFGEALAPLIAACIRIMYIGIMGWIGSILTIRGITIINNLPAVEQRKIVVTSKPKPKPQQKEIEKGQIKEKREPEAVVVFPEPISTPQTQQTSQQPSVTSSTQQQS